MRSSPGTGAHHPGIETEPSGAAGTITRSELHYRILTAFVERGCPPRVDELARTLAASPDAVRSALIDLQEYHGVVLHPGTQEVWVAHPFSAAPTNFWVRTPRVACWANCAWCAMGAVTLLGGHATVSTTIGAEAKQVELHVRDGALQQRGLLVHFPVPMANAWDNVIYTCSVMLLFESEAEVDDWCARHRIARGDVQPLATVLAFAKDWYGRHLDREWKKWSPAEAAALFARHGFRHPVWQLAGGGDRF
jgi:hypothetical protein